MNNPLLVKLFAGELLDLSLLRRELVSLRSTHEGVLGQLEAVRLSYFQRPGQLPVPALLQYLALRRGLRFQRENIEWIDEVLSALERVGA